MTVGADARWMSLAVHAEPTTRNSSGSNHIMNSSFHTFRLHDDIILTSRAIRLKGNTHSKPWTYCTLLNGQSIMPTVPTCAFKDVAKHTPVWMHQDQTQREYSKHRTALETLYPSWTARLVE